MITAIFYSQNSEIKLTVFAEGYLFTLCYHVMGRSVKKSRFLKTFVYTSFQWLYLNHKIFEKNQKNQILIYLLCWYDLYHLK